MADRDPVEVEADALADKVEVVKAVKVGRPIHAEEWAVRRGSMIAEKHLPNGSFEEKDALCAEVAEELSATHANMERTCDDLREMIRTAEARGAEGMREAAKKAAIDEAAAVEALDAFEVGPHAGMAKAQSRYTANRIVAAIDALPVSDAPASPFGLIDCRECLGTGGPHGAMGDPSMGQCSWCGGSGQVYKRIPTHPAKDETA